MTNLVVRRNPVRTYNPWKEMDRMFDSFNRSYASEPRKPIVHVENEERAVKLTAELPGFSAKDINIEVKENLLIIKAIEKAEKKDEQDNIVFERSFVLPEDLKTDKIEAEMKHGLLNLSIPRREKPAPLSVKVKG